MGLHALSDGLALRLAHGLADAGAHVRPQQAHAQPHRLALGVADAVSDDAAERHAGTDAAAAQSAPGR